MLIHLDFKFTSPEATFTHAHFAGEGGVSPLKAHEMFSVHNASENFEKASITCHQLNLRLRKVGYE